MKQGINSFPNSRSSGSAIRLFRISFSAVISPFSTRLAGRPSRVSAEIPRMLHIPPRKETSGRPVFRSHLLTAWGVTPRREANSSCVIFCICRYLQIVSPKFVCMAVPPWFVKLLFRKL